jgi:hypothetical protein
MGINAELALTFTRNLIWMYTRYRNPITLLQGFSIDFPVLVHQNSRFVKMMQTLASLILWSSRYWGLMPSVTTPTLVGFFMTDHGSQTSIKTIDVLIGNIEIHLWLNTVLEHLYSRIRDPR